MRSLSPGDHRGASFRRDHQPAAEFLSEDQQTIVVTLREMEYLREFLRRTT
jgi:hypothetical protein